MENTFHSDVYFESMKDFCQMDIPSIDRLTKKDTCTNGQSIANDNSGLKLRVRTKKLFFLFLNQNQCCGYSKEPSQ